MLCFGKRSNFVIYLSKYYAKEKKISIRVVCDNSKIFKHVLTRIIHIYEFVKFELIFLGR